ncbi:uncharacterized protein BXZ73DRAFT_78997 [Epithele typhae]|uniref:uncharacterized protein n=1 Tax=Epithele typhae TaxID=378194 RepID=UPI0020082B81|nr:uncharacterized protein BXZ73DRAFT_78997 [Epithele typhae]KAH9925680.1 hypothetical protein BXZ73DRAFT_78997 [Epithele typhae]
MITFRDPAPSDDGNPADGAQTTDGGLMPEYRPALLQNKTPAIPIPKVGFVPLPHQEPDAMPPTLVLRRLLTLHSAVLKTVLADPSSPTPEGVTLGTARVDGEKFLCLWGEERHETATEELLAYVRLGHKYKIEGLREQSLKALSDRLHPTFSGNLGYSFDRRSDMDPVLALPSSTSRSTPNPHTFSHMHCFSAPPPSLHVPHIPAMHVYSDGEHEAMDKDAEWLCANATHQLVLTTIAAANSVLLPPLDSCAQNHGRSRSHPSPGSRGDHVAAGPLMWTFLEHEAVKSAEDKLCPACWKEIECRVGRQRRVVWNKLPSLFGVGEIPDWDVQETNRGAAMHEAGTALSEPPVLVCGEAIRSAGCNDMRLVITMECLEIRTYRLRVADVMLLQQQPPGQAALKCQKR